MNVSVCVYVCVIVRFVGTFVGVSAGVFLVSGQPWVLALPFHFVSYSLCSQDDCPVILRKSPVSASPLI